MHRGERQVATPSDSAAVAFSPEERQLTPCPDLDRGKVQPQLLVLRLGIETPARPYLSPPPPWTDSAPRVLCSEVTPVLISDLVYHVPLLIYLFFFSFFSSSFPPCTC